MVRKIRRGIFETNSSTSHALIIMKEDVYDKWENGGYYYSPYNYEWEKKYYTDPSNIPEDKHYYTEDEVRNFLIHNERVEPEHFNFDEGMAYDSFEQLAKEFEFYTYDTFNGEYELDTKNFVTDNGEKYVVHCAYGYDY